MVFLKLKGIDTIEEAENYRNLYIKRKRDKDEILEENTYYIVDILGCKVYTDEQKELARKYKNGDLEAKQTLINSNLLYVVSIAYKFKERLKANGYFVKYILMAFIEDYVNKEYVLEFRLDN